MPKDCDDETLDPMDWNGFRAQGHRMLDDMMDYLEKIRNRPVWQPIPPEIRSRFREPLPNHGTELGRVHERFMEEILPFTVGNAHPEFFGWVHGAGTPVGMLAEMLAAGANANLGGRDQVPIDVEKQISSWAREMFGFPQSATGLLVTGTSMANFIGVLVARNVSTGFSARRQGIGTVGANLVAYASVGAHSSLARAFDLCGLGSDALRKVPVNEAFEIDLAALNLMLAEDRARGSKPFLLIGSAGTVDVGAVDDLQGLAQIAMTESLWFHVDGAYGALAILSKELAPRLNGIEKADSLAFDFHKWGQVPYDAGFVMLRDGEAHLASFANHAAYLHRAERGLAAGSPWPCDYGPDLSRGFRALKVWFTLQVYGSAKLGRIIAKTCHLARYLERRIGHLPQLELLAPVSLNIVCFRYRCGDPDRINMEILIALQESGVAAPSSTRIGGCLAIRVAIFNHRTRESDIDALLEATLALGASLL